ncbi:cyclin-dependent kinase 5 homolog [Zophobas morio]|uniref:cyclin-dependent kinase 5 homolog n=1 Tax=Zophobas morio TaxID=2755281 RepID=UPI003083DCF3
MDVYLSECIIYLVFEYLDCDLRAFLSRTKKTSKELQKSFFKQILKAVAYCHSHCVIHRDIKPENILVSSERIIKLADFGLSRTFEIPKRTYSPEVASLWYRSIEILLSDGEYSAAADIWSVGCVFVELCGHDALFPGKRSMDQIFIIVQKLGTKNIKLLHLPSFVSHLPDFPSPSGRIVKGMNEVENDLLLRMLQYDVKERITAGQALRHQYFDS